MDKRESWEHTQVLNLGLDWYDIYLCTAMNISQQSHESILVQIIHWNVANLLIKIRLFSFSCDCH